MDKFRVALSGDFKNPDGSLHFPFDLTPLTDDPRVEVAFVEGVDRHMPAAGLEGFDALILAGHRVDARSIPPDGRLAIVARFGVGFDTVDLAACTEAGIAVCNAPEGVRRPVAVAIMTFVLALAGQLHFKDKLTRQGPAGWKRRAERMGVGLVGRTFAQLGLGGIGAEAVKLAQPFGLRVIGHDPALSPILARNMGVELVSLEELFRQADFLSVSVPLSAGTRHLVDAERLALMKPSAFLINTARGPVVDQRALYDALVAGRLAGAGLDVFEVEPAPADEPLYTLDNVVLTPHNLCMTDQCAADLGATDVAAVRAVMAGEVPRNVVNAAVLATPRWQERLAAHRTRFAA